MPCMLSTFLVSRRHKPLKGVLFGRCSHWRNLFHDIDVLSSNILRKYIGSWGILLCVKIHWKYRTPQVSPRSHTFLANPVPLDQMNLCYQSVNQSNFYSANIPGVARLSGATARSASYGCCQMGAQGWAHGSCTKMLTIFDLAICQTTELSCTNTILVQNRGMVCMRQ